MEGVVVSCCGHQSVRGAGKFWRLRYDRFNYVFLRRLQEHLAIGGNSLCAVAVSMAGGEAMLDVRDDGLRRFAN